MDKIILQAPAKINLLLDVVGRRENGYHEVRMVMQTIGIYDTIEIRKGGEGIHLAITNPMSKMGEGCVQDYVSADEKNLAYKAAALFNKRLLIKTGKNPECGVDILVTKRIPIAAGLAGGSTDAAAVLNGMNALFGEPFTATELEEMSPEIGADVAFLIRGGTRLCEGIGEVLTDLPTVPSMKLLLAKPDFDVSTKEVYTELDARPIEHHPDCDAMIEAIRRQDGRLVAECMGNVLADVTMRRYPEIGNIVETMKKGGALNAMMSGSGPSVFGIFEEDAQAEAVLMELMDMGYTQLFLTATV